LAWVVVAEGEEEEVGTLGFEILICFLGGSGQGRRRLD